MFVGRPEAQLSHEDVYLPGLCTIASQADARRALTLIVEQGEGSIVCDERSHYARFRTIRKQWQALEQRRPDFTPYRNAARHPVMRPPVSSDERVHIVAEPAVSLLDAGNASYFLMLRLFALMSDMPNCLLPRSAVMAQAMTLMHALADIGTALTTLPANEAHPGVMAGLTFSLSRTAIGFESPDSAAWLIAERMDLLAIHADIGASTLPALAQLGHKLREAARAWRQAHGVKLASEKTLRPDVQPGLASHLAAFPPSLDPQAQIEVVKGKTGTLYFDPSRCVHSRHCVLEEPAVFKANQEGSWIFPDNATPERLARVARNCVSGAIRYERRDGVDNESAPPVNLVHMRQNGPLALNAAIRIVSADGAASDELRVALCRCGQSKNKPFCDQSHLAAGFTASGEALTRPFPDLEQRDGTLVVTPLHNGPLDIRGAAEICTGTGRTVDRTLAVRLCRCGNSMDKPFCDGSHRAAGFLANGTGV